MINYKIEDDISTKINNILPGLEHKKAAVLILRAEGKTLKEIASIMNYAGGERIRQIEAKALRLLSMPTNLYMAKKFIALYPEYRHIESLRERAAWVEREMGTPKSPGEYIDSMGLAIRTSNILKRHNIFLIKDLIEKKESELLEWFDLGRKSINEIKELLYIRGLRLKD